MSHERHWSGAHCHECFIEQAMSEPRPTDDKSEFDCEGLMLDVLFKHFGPRKLRDELPEHYKEQNAKKPS